MREWLKCSRAWLISWVLKIVILKVNLTDYAESALHFKNWMTLRFTKNVKTCILQTTHRNGSSIMVITSALLLPLHFKFVFQRVLNLMGNPVIKKIKNYRKILTVRCVSITVSASPVENLNLPDRLLNNNCEWKICLIRAQKSLRHFFFKILFAALLKLWKTISFWLFGVIWRFISLRCHSCRFYDLDNLTVHRKSCSIWMTGLCSLRIELVQRPGLQGDLRLRKLRGSSGSVKKGSK